MLALHTVHRKEAPRETSWSFHRAIYPVLSTFSSHCITKHGAQVCVYMSVCVYVCSFHLFALAPPWPGCKNASRSSSTVQCLRCNIRKDPIHLLLSFRCARTTYGVRCVLVCNGHEVALVFVLVLLFCKFPYHVLIMSLSTVKNCFRRIESVSVIVHTLPHARQQWAHPVARTGKN